MSLLRDSGCARLPDLAALLADAAAARLSALLAQLAAAGAVAARRAVLRRLGDRRYLVNAQRDMFPPPRRDRPVGARVTSHAMAHAIGYDGRRRGAQEQCEREFAFQCKALRLPEPIEQYQFAPPRRFKADFAWPQYRLLVEVQGGIWRRGGGAHSHPLDLERDIERTQHMALLGWWFLPVTTDEVRSGHAVEVTQRVLHRLGWQP